MNFDHVLTNGNSEIVLRLLIATGLGLVVGVGEYVLAVIITGIIFGTLLIDRIKRFSEGGTYEEERD